MCTIVPIGSISNRLDSPQGRSNGCLSPTDTWAPKSKSAVIKSVMRRLRITEIGFAEDGYQDLLTRGGLEKNPIPLWKECATFSA
jgi:hypothetical protein